MTWDDISCGVLVLDGFAGMKRSDVDVTDKVGGKQRHTWKQIQDFLTNKRNAERMTAVGVLILAAGLFTVQ